MSEAENFMPPSAVLIHGEGLARMSLDQYTNFVAFLGGQGLQVSVPEEYSPYRIDPVETEHNLEVPNQLQSERDTSPEVLLMDFDEIKAAAKENGMRTNTITMGMFRIMCTSRYYPATQEAIRRSREFIGARALAYYPPELLTEQRRRQFEVEGIDPTDGFVSKHIVYERVKDKSGVLPVSLRDIENILSSRSKYDIVSLQEYIGSAEFRGLRNIGSSVVLHYGILCQRILQNAGLASNEE